MYVNRFEDQLRVYPRQAALDLRAGSWGAACIRSCGPRHGMILSNHQNGGVSCTYLNPDRNSAHPSSMIESEIAWRHSTHRIKGADRGRLQIIESTYGPPAFLSPSQRMSFGTAVYFSFAA